MKPLIIYHANCDDGFGAALAAWLKFGNDAEYLPMNYDDPAHDNAAALPAFEGRNVYILDFSLARPVMETLLKATGKVVWLDHHKTAFEMWCPPELNRHEEAVGDDSYILLDNNKSGAMLAWEYFHPSTPAPMLIRHIDDNDRWQFKIKTTKAFIAALRTWPHDFEVWSKIALEEGQFNYLQLCDAGYAVLRAQDEMISAVLAATKRQAAIRAWSGEFETVSQGGVPIIETHLGLAVNLPVKILQSDAGHRLAVESGTFGLLWYQNADGSVSCSLRSNGDYDVSAIAKCFGGGGHKNAAGFTTTMSTLQSWFVL
jgi:oligoribonuclease NrnB/cAMP/cGMP phosphodiesterase (DHH superfamily)